MADAEVIQIPGVQMIEFVEKLDKVVELILKEMPSRSMALDVALLDLRDASKTLADSIELS